jgi:hypothetical protein
MKLGWVRDGTILVGIGLSLFALGAEAMGVFDACIASVSCSPGASGLSVEEFLGLIVGGLTLATAGSTFLALGLRISPRTMGTVTKEAGVVADP